jgi:hypothetical protein
MISSLLTIKLILMFSLTLVLTVINPPEHSSCMFMLLEAEQQHHSLAE